MLLLKGEEKVCLLYEAALHRAKAADPVIIVVILKETPQDNHLFSHGKIYTAFTEKNPFYL